MISRRELLTSGVAGGLAANAEESARTDQRSDDTQTLRSIADNVRSIDSSIGRAWLSNAVVFGHAARVREQFETFFRTNQKFPDFIDVGIAVFLDIYDWHIKTRQPLTISRGPDARYWMQFMFTTIILRGEHDQNYVGIPYDKA